HLNPAAPTGGRPAQASGRDHRASAVVAPSAWSDPEVNLPGGDGNGFYTSQLSQTLSAAFRAFPPDRYADLYERYLGLRRTLSTPATCGGWIPASSVQPGSTLDRVLNSGVLRIGFVYHSPYLYLDTAGRQVGFEYDLAYGLLGLIQARYPERPLRIEWIPVD